MLQNTKRKLPDSDEGTGTTSNPLVSAAKKAKREGKMGASNKRKFTEEQPGGLLIVRGPQSSAPPTTKLVSKKFKSSQPLPSTSKPPSKSSLLPSSQQQPLSRHDTPDADPALDDAVRAMQDEAAHLRRTSRGPVHDSSSRSSSGPNARFRFPADSTANGAGKGKRRETIVDTSAPLPPEGDETPLINRNKRLRASAMAALRPGQSDAGPELETPPRPSSSVGSSGHRRKSSVGGRGKRISSSFESTGVITQPHPTVADTSFYKHIDADLPDAERVRQLLIWCSARAASASSVSTSTPATTNLALPPLSATAAQALKAVQDDVVRRLAERKVDLSLYGSSEADRGGEKKENAQNVRNRVWEGVYGGHIRSAMEEEESWKQTGFFYDSYAKRVRTTLEKRRAALLPSESPSTPSAKAQGKQRAVDSLEPRTHELPPQFQTGMRLARTVFARARRRRPELPPTASPGAGPSTRKGADPDLRALPTTRLDVDVHQEQEREAEADAAFSARLAQVEFKLDHLHVLASQARAAAEAAQLALDRRFEVLVRALDARTEPPLGGEGGILGRYVRGEEQEKEKDDARQLLRALARVDAARPPALVGDAARRAVREVQRVGESGVGVVGERRLTDVPPGGVGVTPRKMPGTPRRGTTPSRDRER